LTWAAGTLDVADVSTVWYRRPKPIESFATESAGAPFAAQEWTAAIEGFLELIPRERWMNYPGHIAAASQKWQQLAAAKQSRLLCPETIVTTSTKAAIDFCNSVGGSVVGKPLMSGYLERQPPDLDTQIYSNLVTTADLQSHGASLGCPTLFQRAIEKVADVRIVVVDRQLCAVALHAHDGRLDIRRANFEGVTYEPIDIPTAVSVGLLSLTERYQLRFAAVDFVIGCDGGWYFLEVNPNGQWAWLDLHGATRLHELFEWSFRQDMEGPFSV
jgi:glutathione synthase/RimK-type ligase-like ATP-grasp enzyme